MHCINAFSEEFGRMREAFVEEAEFLEEAKLEEIENIVPKPETSMDVMNDAVGGLVNAGFGRNESRQAVARVTKDKEYTDPMEIIQAVFARE